MGKYPRVKDSRVYSPKSQTTDSQQLYEDPERLTCGLNYLDNYFIWTERPRSELH